MSKVLSPRQRDVSTFYGTIADMQRGRGLVKVQFPYQHYYDGKPMKQTTCHMKVAEAYLEVLRRTLEHYGAEQIHKLKLDDFSGCLNIRQMRGGSAWSMHSWGIAFDYNAADNMLHQHSGDENPPRFCQPIYDKWFEFWYDAGAISLGKERDFDWMHTQFARL